jgi:hypothetical protein
MGRPPNKLKTAITTVATTAVQRAYLAALVETGLYGKSVPDAAERLIATGLERLIKEGTIRLLGAEGERATRLGKGNKRNSYRHKRRV